MVAAIKPTAVFTREDTIAWRPVPGYETRYQVSNKGTVFSIKARQLLHPTSRHGYRFVTLYDGSAGRTSGFKVKVSRLVLLAFVGPAPEGTEACHDNDVKHDDHVCNLYWGTRQQNVADARRNGTIARGERNGQSKLTDKQREEIRNSRETGVALARRMNVSQTIISMTRNGQRGAQNAGN